MSLLALDKWARLWRIIGQHGGIVGSLFKLWRMETLKEGKYMGRDYMHNKYYENKNYMIGRSRWVEFSPNVRFEYDASMVSPEWHGWLHYKTDRLPCEDWAKYCILCCPWTQCWMLPPEENMTGTEQAYYPYTTVPSKVYVWDGRSICNRPCLPVQ